jgi:hypothetical protein
MSRLGALGLDWTQVDDEGLAHLTGLTRLQWLYLSGTRVTNARLRGFQRALPKVDVVRGWLG